jgi:hypothetical protein
MSHKTARWPPSRAMSYFNSKVEGWGIWEPGTSQPRSEHTRFITGRTKQDRTGRWWQWWRRQL